MVPQHRDRVRGIRSRVVGPYHAAIVQLDIPR
ncbi:hypothetical protein STIAU_3631, partial [Stigmatella aurantiaca DW4/3-1]